MAMWTPMRRGPRASTKQGESVCSTWRGWIALRRLIRLQQQDASWCLPCRDLCLYYNVVFSGGILQF